MWTKNRVERLDGVGRGTGNGQPMDVELMACASGLLTGVLECR